MEEKLIADVLDKRISGEWGKDPVESNAVKVLRTTNFTNQGVISYENVSKRAIDDRKVVNKKLQFGDTIIEKSGGGPKQPVGRVVFFDLDSDEDFLCNNFTAILRPSKEIHPKYFFYCLYSMHLKGKTLKYQSKTTGIINLQLDRYINTEKILIPNLKEQEKIVKKLDSVNLLIQQRNESLELLDQYLTSVFLGMFGDPISNPKKWPTKTIEEIVKREKYSIKRGPFGGSLKKDMFVEEGYLVYEQFHALNRDFSFARYYIDEKKFQELKAFEVKAGDIIISCSGVYLGKLAEIPQNYKKGIINQALLKISLDNEIMRNKLFMDIFTNPSFKAKYLDSKIGSGIPNFPPVSVFKTFQFICPEMNIQKEYENKVKEVENLRNKMHEQVSELEQLMQSFNQKYFSN